jgi:hypothetical protein
LLAIVPKYYMGFRSPYQVALCQAHYGAESSSWPELEINPPDEGAYADKQHLEELRAEGQPQELFCAQKA